jgi:VWFA-related protein
MSFRSADKFLSLLLLPALYGGFGSYSFPQTAQSGGAVHIRSDVELVTVEVTALDKEGNPFHNLKKEDFQLYEDGKKQEILSFDEVKGSFGTSSLGVLPVDDGLLRRGKIVLILFNHTIGSSAAIKDAEEFVKKRMRPGDLFGVASFGIEMKIIKNITGDRDEVLAAIGRAAGINEPRNAGSKNLEDLLRALEQINISLAPLKGQKSVLIYGHAMQFGNIPNSLGTAYKKALDSAKKSNVRYYTIGGSRSTLPQPLSAGAVDASNSAPPVQLPGNIAKGRAVTSNGATTVYIDSSGSIGSSRAYEVGDAGPVLYLPLSSLASDSGGGPIYPIESELEKFDQQISNYYILGFQSSNPKHDGSFRKLQVNTELKGATLKHRSGYLDRRPIDVLASSKTEKTLTATLASSSVPVQLPIVFRPAYFFESSGFARVLIQARIATEKLALKKKGDELAAEVNLMGVAYAEDGSTAARFSQTVPVSCEKEKEQEFRKEGFRYRNYFKLRPGKYRLKMAASDESSNLGAIEQSLEIPALQEKRLTGSSIVLIETTSHLSELIQDLRAQLLDESNPLLYSGMQIEPRAENKLQVDAAIQVLFRIYNLSGSYDQWNLSARPKLINEKGDAISLDSILLKKIISPATAGQGVVALNLPFRGAAPGKYKLVLEVSDAASTETATLQTDLELR